MELRLDNPLWLWLLIPAIAYFAIIGYRNYKKYSDQYRIVYVLRIMAVLLVIFALAAPGIYRPAAQEQIIFLVDRSASMEGTQAGIAAAIDSAMAGKKDSQSVGVYTFAEDFQTLLPVSKEFRPLPKDQTQNENRHTNIARALELAANSGDTGIATRLIVLTDGNETQDSALESLNRLEGDRIQIDVMPIEQEARNDAGILSFKTPANAFLGESQVFSVQIEADKEAEGQLVFSKNDKEMDRQDIVLVEGENLFSYAYPAKEEGLAKYEARLELEDDAFLENNALISMTEIEGSPELLVVNGSEESPIPELLDTENIRVTNIAANNLPANLSSILQYDAVIFDNVSGTTVGGQQMAVIEQAVQQFGMGFMMVGGDQSFGLGGYFKSPIERILPVEMEVKGKHELPSLGLVIVMDRSGSMAGTKMELAKEAAARSVELLREDDTVGVIAFDDQPWQIVPTEKLKNPKDAADKILSVTPGGGTEIYRSLEEAYSQLEDLKLQRKHIILLTDGQSSTQNDYDSLIENGKENNVTLSTVSIGADADKNLLESLATTGNGRYYDVTDATTIPAILSRETIMMSRTYIVDEPFRPIVYESNWNNLFNAGIPKMNAYIATTSKSTASVALESEEEDPVLATWNYGLGKTIAYTSGSGAWSGDFQSWNNWPAFWNRAVSELLPSFAEIPFSVTAQQQGVYSIEDPSQSSAIIDVTVVDEEGNEIPIKTEPVAPGKVEVTMDADPGLVFFSISNENGASYKTGLTVPYGDEFKILSPNVPMLTTLAERSGGQVLESLDTAMRDVPYESGAQQPIQQLLLFLAMLLFFTDITIRRFGLRIPARKHKNEDESADAHQTIGQLIKAKKRN
ncbi:VWA domain-containing protein [Planococcus shenhongbingii]|uniref:VWA domain-containing protein n=1 Tax=Planococcus shenhongbingii TaxID=3058398 RepID=A0ABT8N8X0_9BACL|nr:VWA domain-containing protein [Planococcus sp. N017]MDN7244338.1 VWA domain-containing protein [Planococcus sp. N017]